MRGIQYWAAVVLSWCVLAQAFVDYGIVYPVKYSLGTTHTRTGLQPWTKTTSFTLSKANPVLTLDFGYEVAGFPFFDTASVSSAAQIEVKYAETFASLDAPEVDGPWTFSNGLSNNFRVETFNVTKSGNIESFFLQGGQRWMVVKLLTSDQVTFKDVGFRATSQTTDVDKLPGYMKTSNDLYNKIFDLGGRVVQPACVDAGNAPSTWEITSDGAYIRGQTTAMSAKGVGAANYTLTFDTKIVRGGTGWRVASAIVPLGQYFLLTSNYPASNTFINTNRTLLPPNTLIFNSDWSLVNQTTIPTPPNQYYPVNVPIEEGKWYRISTSIQETGYEVKINGKKIAFVPLPPAIVGSYFATPSRYEGTWAFGAFQEHLTYYKNVNVVANNGTQIYSNPMTSQDTLAEYQVAPLDTSVCLDGAKRDRLVWIGDFYHTVRVVAQSSARFDQLLGSIRYVLEYQNERPDPFAGFVPISPNLGSRPEYKHSNPTWGGLIDYQDLFLAGIGEYFRYTGDVDGLKASWPQIKKLAAAKINFIEPSTGLVGGSASFRNPVFFLGPGNGSAVTGLFAFALDRLAPLADAVNDKETSTLYTKTADSLRTAINQQLWNDKLGAYSLSTGARGNFSLTGIAWAILCGAANATQAASSIAKLEQLRLGIGYKTISSDADSPDYQLAPNPSGFLLEALFQTKRAFGTNSTTASAHLLNGLWAAMVSQDEYSTGASWEYVKPDGAPGLDLFTSHGHPWGAAPTYVFQEYLLGMQASKPGYREFVVRPLVGYLGVNETMGRVATPKGALEVQWKVRDGKAEVLVEVPEGLSGMLRLPAGWRIESGEDGEKVALGSGGARVVLCAV